MEILVNNIVKEIEIIDPETEWNWEMDLIGNHNGFDGYDEDHEMYTMEEETFEWWSNYCKLEQEIQNKAKQIRDIIDVDDCEKFNEAMIEYANTDLDDVQHYQKEVIEEWEENIRNMDW